MLRWNAARVRPYTIGSDADVLLFEGMICGYDGDDEGGNTSVDVVEALDAEVVVLFGRWAASQTGAAVALDLQHVDPDVRIAGVICNRVGGMAHERCRTSGPEFRSSTTAADSGVSHGIQPAATHGGTAELS